VDDRTLARWRMHTLRLAGQPHGSAEDVVRGLLAVQSENRPQAMWAVATRTTGISEPDVQQLLDDGTVLRTHVLRGTWHFVLPDDIRWLVELTAPGLRRTYRSAQQGLGLTDVQLQRARTVIVDALGGTAALSRRQLGERLRGAGLPAEGQRLGLMLGDAEQQALICSGPGGADSYALLAARAPSARRLDREEALAELVLRYVTGHGPATARDLTYWATLTRTDVRAGLGALGDRLERTEHDGRTYWSAGGPPDDLRLEPRAHLLQTLDEYHNGFQDSRYLLDLAGLVPRARLPRVGMVLVDGQMVGGMRRDVGEAEVVFDVHLYRDLDDGEQQAVADAADRYGAFLGRPARLTFTPR
jgi:hypothetical protein